MYTQRNEKKNTNKQGEKYQEIEVIKQQATGVEGSDVSVMSDIVWFQYYTNES
jgi:hypothetical protein